MNEEKTALVLSRNIKEYMDLYSLNMSDMARLLGVSPSAVRFWVTGEKAPRLKYLDKMCEIFHCTQGDLVSEDPIFQVTAKDKLLQEIVDKAIVLNSEGKQKVIDYIDDISVRFRQ